MALLQKLDDYMDMRKFGAKRGAIAGAAIGALTGILTILDPNTKQYSIEDKLLATSVGIASCAMVFSVTGYLNKKYIRPSLDKFFNYIERRYFHINKDTNSQ
ncbi:MAG TPA: hypothetical protein VJJ23_05390 [Candidatus Nanoarchaeia archaeon]|nr:hypothetical protein [Candidatus Nanoarchaeia archaeon]